MFILMDGSESVPVFFQDIYVAIYNHNHDNAWELQIFTSKQFLQPLKWHFTTDRIWR